MCKINFFWKKMRLKSVVLQPRKKLQVLEKIFFREKNFFQLICADIIFKTVCGIFFLNKWVSSYLSFGVFKVPKNGSSQ